ANALFDSAILWVSSRRLTLAPRPLLASSNSFCSRSTIVFSRRAREYVTNQRSASVVERPGLTSIGTWKVAPPTRSEEHTSELQSRENLVCRLLLEKKNLTSAK